MVLDALNLKMEKFTMVFLEMASLAREFTIIAKVIVFYMAILIARR
jgi:hypothetical protein